MRIAYNDSHDNLWCVECKRRINLGEKFAEITEDLGYEKIKKTYHLDCLPAEEEDLIAQQEDE